MYPGFRTSKSLRVMYRYSSCRSSYPCLGKPLLDRRIPGPSPMTLSRSPRGVISPVCETRPNTPVSSPALRVLPPARPPARRHPSLSSLALARAVSPPTLPPLLHQDLWDVKRSLYAAVGHRGPAGQFLLNVVRAALKGVLTFILCESRYWFLVPSPPSQPFRIALFVIGGGLCRA